MARAQEISSSLPGAVAQNIVGSVSSGLTATGTNLATALQLPSAINEFTTVASGTGAVLFVGELPGTKIEVYNGGANALLIYAATGETINASAASFSVASGKYAMFTKRNGTQWASILSA